MTGRISAKHYAQAVFELDLEQEEVDCLPTDMEKVVRLGQDATVVAYLRNPKVHFEDKAKILAERLVGIDPIVLNLVYLLLTKDRLEMLADIADEYQRILDKHDGVERAEVTTAIPIDDEVKIKLNQRLGDIVGKKVVSKFKVDHSIIGGFVARVAGKLIDGSTRHKLAALNREMA